MSKILLAGATGYVGGTVLSQLLRSTENSLRYLTIDLLVRREDQVQKLRDVYGGRVRTVLWKGLDDVDFIEETAAQYDIIVNAGSGFITAGAKAFVDGLARRVKTGQPTPWLLHLSGCTNLVDPSKQPYEWNDERDGRAIFDYMKTLDDEEPYSQRTTEVTVLESAAEKGVQAVSLQAPCIFGEGSGLFNQQALVIPMILRYAVQHGYGFKLNDKANFDWVCLSSMECS
jgi:nucleoside-diphosphate-sugar epimerase